MVLAQSNLCEQSDFDVLSNFLNVFNFEFSKSWNYRVTHLVVKTKDGFCTRSTKFTNAILAHCFIVSFEWVKKCLSSMTLLSEVYHILKNRNLFSKN